MQDPQALAEIRIQGTAPTYTLRRDVMKQVTGDYELSTGQPLKISRERTKLFVQFDQRPPAELMPQSRYVFTSADLDMKIEFDRNAYGDKFNMSYLPEPTVANAHPQPVTLVAGR